MSPTNAHSLSRRPSLGPTPPPYIPHAIWDWPRGFGPAHSCAYQLPAARTACVAWSVPYKRTQPLSQTVPRPNTTPIPPVCFMGLAKRLWVSPQLRLPAARCRHSLRRLERPLHAHAASLADRPSAQHRPHTSSMLYGTGQEALGRPTAAPTSCPLPAQLAPPGASPTSARSLSRRPSLSPTPPPYLPSAVRKWSVGYRTPRSCFVRPSQSRDSELRAASCFCGAPCSLTLKPEALPAPVPRPATGSLVLRA